MKNIEMLKIWEKGSYKRAYLSEKAVATAIGMTFRKYKTGNIAEATLDGEKISNSEARKIFNRFANAYYDMINNTWSFDETAEYADRIIEFFN